MDIEQAKSIIEAVLFATGREVKIKELVNILELSPTDIDMIIQNMKTEFTEQNRGIEIIKVEDGYQLCTKKEYYEYIYPLFDNRSKPKLSNAALETLAIIAYNPRVTRAEIEEIRGVKSDGTIYKLLEYELIEEAGKLDAPGRPTTYRTTTKFLKMFGYTTLDELPPLPKYKIDENEQIVLEEVINDKAKEETEEKAEENVQTEKMEDLKEDIEED